MFLLWMMFGAAFWDNGVSTDTPLYESFTATLAAGCPRGQILFVGRVSAGTARTNEEEKS